MVAETGKHLVFPSLDGTMDGDTRLDAQLIGWYARRGVHEKFTLSALRYNEYVSEAPELIRARANAAVRRMFEVDPALPVEPCLTVYDSPS